MGGLGVHIKSIEPILSTQSYDFLWAHWKRRKKGFHHQKERDCYLAACLWQKSNLIHCSAYWFHTYLVTIYTSPITTSRYHKSFDNSFPILKVYIIQKRNTLLPYLSALDFCNYPVWWTLFLVYFKLEFYRLQHAEKPSSN